jgi:hypothetical protein
MVEAITLVCCSGPMNEWLEKFAEVFGAALAEAVSTPLAASTAAPVAAIVVMTAADRLVGFIGIRLLPLEILTHVRAGRRCGLGHVRMQRLLRAFRRI